jgi:hypothetical protein
VSITHESQVRATYLKRSSKTALTGAFFYGSISKDVLVNRIKTLGEKQKSWYNKAVEKCF